MWLVGVDGFARSGGGRLGWLVGPVGFISRMCEEMVGREIFAMIMRVRWNFKWVWGLMVVIGR